MASSSTDKAEQRSGALSPRSARAQMEEALGKLDILEEEATPLVIDDSEEGSPHKWLIAGKVLFRNLLHIQSLQFSMRAGCALVISTKLCMALNISHDHDVMNGRCVRFVRNRSRIRRVCDLFLPESKEWNEELVTEDFCPNDAEVIFNINIPSHEMEDAPAWHNESSGHFSVCSAYKLAYSLKHRNDLQTGSSTAPKGDRNMRGLVWKADVPNKVHSFGWKLACDDLATKENKCKRNPEIDKTCNICGRGNENSFHAVVVCTKARVLRDQMRGVWELPEERVFTYTGPDWLLLLLAKINPR
ncbi:Ubiquitin carboxyl-terminal hydrolase 2 [Hordeum vulgare]|nr:Ubiquitin carboxyl-terminal hydrolase 2 [Hordeum vulgare]